MPNAPDNHDAHDYAERIRERLPRRLQELRETAGFTKDGLARESGVSRDYIQRHGGILTKIGSLSPKERRAKTV